MLRFLSVSFSLYLITSIAFGSNYQDRVTVKKSVLEESGGFEKVREEFLSIALSHGVPEHFPPEVLDEAKVLAEIAEESLQQVKAGKLRLQDAPFFSGLKDMSGLPFITIDNDYSKDLDQAMYIKNEVDGGFTVYYAISDASFFLTPGSPIDQFARKKLFTTYLPDSDLPILPRILSEGFCSLNPSELRRAIVVVIPLSQNGQVRTSEINFQHSVVRSIKQLSYRGVQEYYDALSAGRDHPYISQDFESTLQNLRVVGVNLIAAARVRGVVNFPEGEFRIFPEGKSWSAGLYKRFQVEKYNEQISVIANQAVARHLEKSGVVSLHRFHPAPEDYMYRSLRHKLNVIKSYPRWKKDSPLNLLVEQYNQKLENPQSDNSRYFAALTVTGRINQRAVYSFEESGHDGLKLTHYDHFTAPMRRYPDVINHRILLSVLEGTEVPYQEEVPSDLADAINQASSREKNIERLSEQFMSDLILKSGDGHKITATVIYIHKKFITLKPEGLPFDLSIPLSKLPEYSADRAQTDISTKTGKTYSLGKNYPFLVSLDEESGHYLLLPSA